jgi:hypothetical protein
MLWPNGDPCSSPIGAWAVARASALAQRPPNRCSWVTSGLTGGSSIRQYTCCGVWAASGKGAVQFGQTLRQDSTMRSGLGCSGRSKPDRLPAFAGTSLARRAAAIGRGFVLLLPLRRRFGGVVRRLRRTGQGREPRFQCRDAYLLHGNDGQRRLQPRGQRRDRRGSDE